MDNIDWGEKFERILTYSFGYPKTSIYFANYYTQLEKVKALLFSVCIKERNISPEKYSIEEIEQLEDFEKRLLDSKNYSVVKEIILFSIIGFIKKVHPDILGWTFFIVNDYFIRLLILFSYNIIHSNKYLATTGFTAFPRHPTRCVQPRIPSLIPICSRSGISRTL